MKSNISIVEAYYCVLYSTDRVRRETTKSKINKELAMNQSWLTCEWLTQEQSHRNRYFD